MPLFTIIPAGRESTEPFSPYRYDILRDGRKVAELRHNYRGEEHQFRLPGGRWGGPNGRMGALPEGVIQGCGPPIAGGGPEPLVLTATGVQAVRYLLGE